MPTIASRICARLSRSTYRSVCSVSTAVIKNLAASMSLAILVFFYHASALGAQVPASAGTSDVPVLPMDIKFRQVPRYFEQTFSGNSRYARIEALIDDQGCDIIVFDKSMNREALYSNVKRRADVLASDGIDAYMTPIDFAATTTDDSRPLFVFRFQDQFGEDVTWRFVPGEMALHASPETIFYTHSGITLLYAPHRAPAAAGTVLTIAGRDFRPESTLSHDSLNGFYATDMTISAILPGTGLWNLDGGPEDILQPAKWTLTGSGGQQRILAVKQLSDTEAAVEQTDPNNPDVPQVVFHVVRANGSYGISWLILESHGNKLWIFFGPALPLPARRIDTARLTFTIAENEQANVATGELEVQRSNNAERLLWRFDTPNAARGTAFTTGVNLIPGTRGPSMCVNESCSGLR